MRKPQRTDGSAWQASLGLWCVALAALTALAVNSLVWAQLEPARARITIDARKVQGRISSLLYGEFMEFMYEDNKSGLYSQHLSHKPLITRWCERGDSNPHPLRDQILSLARLPIPPLSRFELF